FRIEDWHVTHPTQPGRTVVDGASLNVRAGEVVGIAGLMGAGRTEFMMSVFGRSYGRDASGKVFLRGKEISTRTVREAIDNGLAYVSEDRKQYGLNLITDIKTNISSSALGKLVAGGVFVDGNEEIKVAEQYRRDLNIKSPTVAQIVGNLSGGNQQKVALAKWLTHAPKVLVLSEPTRGMDVGAKDDVVQIVRGLRDQGIGVVVVSAEP
ncbi:sugar ABC transporter ATP-binding protein, partial [Bacillus tequilensis]|nr:sugar ABC transporter ATP-binding protein [Bacillus tequilensis]